MKPCRKCGSPERDKRGRCAPCKRRVQNDYRLRHPDRVRESHRKYHAGCRASENERSRQRHQNNKERDRIASRNWRLAHTVRILWIGARRRAWQNDLAFDIAETDILIPKVCPVLGIPLVVGKGHAHDGSPSLDRIIPSKGYIKTNIVVISHRANTIKQNATADEIERVAIWLRGQS